MKLRNWFFGKIRQQLELSAFGEYNGPMLESLDLYIAKSGEEIAGEQTYNFEDRGKRRLAVRPEMTPTVARLVAAKINELNMPLKWFSIPNLYRYERPQRGRLREHWQVNVDIFGCDGYEADLEVIMTAISLLKIFGADESMFKVRISNRRFFNEIIGGICGGDAELVRKVSKVIDRKNKISRDVYEEELGLLGISAESIAKIDSMYTMSIDEAIALCPDTDGAKELSCLFSQIRRIGLEKYCVFDFGIIRGFDYYTGTVFEVYDLDPENNRAMFGGGRYDNLVGLFVKNTHVSGVGFGFGDVTLENFLVSHNLIPDIYNEGTKVLVTKFDDVPYEKYVELLNMLRERGIVSSIYIGSKKFQKQIDYAAKDNYSHIVIMGSGELADGVVKVKNLSSREEKICAFAELANFDFNN
jgi:histidyl-tRNA synthetase